MKVGNLMDDLKDGTRLLALLEILSGERLPFERGRTLRRPHYLSNCNTALEFLRSKRVSVSSCGKVKDWRFRHWFGPQIKLVNINASDVVDGRPAVVLGLIWTIILYFQVSLRPSRRAFFRVVVEIRLDMELVHKNPGLANILYFSLTMKLRCEDPLVVREKINVTDKF